MELKKYLKTFCLATIVLMQVSVILAETKLTYPQREAVKRQEWNLKEVEKKIKAGFAPDDAKWLHQKLDNVINDLTKNKCPDDNSEVAAMKTRVAEARKLIGGPSPDSKPENKEEPAKVGPKTTDGTPPPPEKKAEESKTMPPAAQDVKLTYPQRQAVDRQIRNLTDLEKSVNGLKEAEPKIKYYRTKVEPGLGYDKKMNSIVDDLTKANCPKENSQVADIYNRLESLKVTIAELEVKLKPKYDEYDKYTNIANYPQYDADYEQLKRLFQKYNNSERFYTNQKRADELLSSYSDDADFFNALHKKYAPLINFKMPAGEKLLKQMKTVQTHMMNFHTAKTTYAEKLPGEIDSQLKSAMDMANEAVAGKKPAFFGGGVRQWMEKAESSVSMLESIKGADDATAKASREKLNNQKVKIEAMAKTMEEQILAGNKVPDEVYAGGDKEDLRKRIIEAWKKKYPNDEILKVVMHRETWDKINKWTYNSATVEWYKTDKSNIAGLVVVKTDDKIATMYPAFINKDHLNNDKITMGVDTKGGAYVNTRVLLSNVK